MSHNGFEFAAELAVVGAERLIVGVGVGEAEVEPVPIGDKLEGEAEVGVWVGRLVKPGRVGTVVTVEADGAPEVGLFGATVCKRGVVVEEELGVSVLGVALEGEVVLGETVVGLAVDVAVGSL
jgi:hypothetical protein